MRIPQTALSETLEMLRERPVTSSIHVVADEGSDHE
jgi:hypothetical protein